jgi:hypothetical protein
LAITNGSPRAACSTSRDNCVFAWWMLIVCIANSDKPDSMSLSSKIEIDPLETGFFRGPRGISIAHARKPQKNGSKARGSTSP